MVTAVLNSPLNWRNDLGGIAASLFNDRILLRACVHVMHVHTRVRRTMRSVPARDQLSSLHSIIHAVRGLAEKLFISRPDLVLLSGSALQKTSRHNSVPSNCVKH